MNNKKTLFSIGIVFLLGLTVSIAEAKITVEASIRKQVLRVGEHTRLSISISSDQGENLNQPQMPQIDGLYFEYAGQQQGSTAVWSGGSFKRTDSLDVEYIVTALTEGTYVIKGIRVQTNSGVVQTKPIKITVLGGQAPQPTPQGGGQPQPDPKSYGVDFTLVSNKEEAYVGEEVLLTCQVYLPANKRIQPKSLDDRRGQFQGFWTEIFDLTDRQNQRQMYYQNQRYYEIPLKRYLLYPLKSGKHTIESLDLHCQIPVRTRSRFGMVLGRMQEFTVSSNPVTIQVKPLPEEGQPDIFEGAVGSSYKLHSEVDTTEVKEGNTVSLKVVLAGQGNLRNVPPPVLPDLSKFERYDPTKKENISVGAEGVTGRIAYTYPLIPHDVNSDLIGSVQYAYFDPQKEQYIKLQTDPIELTIQPSGITGRALGPTGSRRMITRVGEDFRFNAVTSLALTSVSLAVHRQTGYWLYSSIPLLLLIGAYAWKRRMDFFSKNPARLKSKKAPKLAGKLLVEARNALQEKQPEKVFAALSKTLADYIDNRWNLNSKGMTSEELSEALNRVGVSSECTKQVIQMLEEFDSARFSGEKRSPEQLEDAYSKGEQVLALLMKQKTR